VSSNDDRIAKWRARREVQQSAKAAHGDLPTDLAVVAAQAEALATGDSLDVEPILALVLDTVRVEPSETVAERRLVYDAVARGIERGIDKADPHSDYAELRRRQLRAIIRLIEGEARAGANVAERGYRPAGLEDAIKPLVEGYWRRRRRTDAEEQTRARRQAVLADEAYTIAVPPEEEGDLLILRELLGRIDGRRIARHSRRQGHPNLRAWMAILRYQFALLRSESRIALAWTLIGPAVLLGLIATAYYLSGINSVLNMDVPTFAMSGATTWLMFRNVIFRSTASFHAHRWLLNLQPVSPAMVGLAQGLMVMGSYVGVFFALIGVGHLAGLFSLPEHPFGVAFWIACMGMAGLAFGIIFGALAVIWPYSPRFAPAVERFLQLFSSVILVSEQLPAAWRPYALWSPLAHAMQMIRSDYFEGYKSEDASPEYFFIGLGILIVIAVISQRVVRWRSIPM